MSPLCRDNQATKSGLVSPLLTKPHEGIDCISYTDAVSFLCRRKRQRPHHVLKRTLKPKQRQPIAGMALAVLQRIGSLPDDDEVGYNYEG